MLLPVGNVYLSTCGLMLSFFTPFGVVQAVHLDFVIEMADVTDDRLVFHLQHVLQRDDVAVAGGGDINVRLAERVFDGGDFETFHRRLQGVDGIDFGDDDARAESAQRMRAAFADIAVAADDRDFAGDHDVRGALDAVGERFAAAVEIVELRFGDGVVDVDGRHQQLAGFQHLIKAMHAGGGFFAKRLSNLSRLRARSRGVPWRTRLSRFLMTSSSWLPLGVLHPIVAVFELDSLCG